MASPFESFADPSTADGRKLWELAIKPLRNAFDGGRAVTNAFVAQLRTKFNMCRWMHLVPFPAPVGGTNNLFDNADLITIGMIDTARELWNIAAREDPTAIPPALVGDQPAIDAHQADVTLQARTAHPILGGNLHPIPTKGISV